MDQTAFFHWSHLMGIHREGFMLSNEDTPEKGECSNEKENHYLHHYPYFH